MPILKKVVVGGITERIDINLHRSSDPPNPSPISPNTGLNIWVAGTETEITDLVDQENNTTSLSMDVIAGNAGGFGGGGTCTHERWGGGSEEHFCDNGDVSGSAVTYRIQGFDANESPIDLNFFCSDNQAGTMHIEVQSVDETGAIDINGNTDATLVNSVQADASGYLDIEMIADSGACVMNLIGIDRYN